MFLAKFFAVLFLGEPLCEGSNCVGLAFLDHGLVLSAMSGHVVRVLPVVNEIFVRLVFYGIFLRTKGGSVRMPL